MTAPPIRRSTPWIAAEAWPIAAGLSLLLPLHAAAWLEGGTLFAVLGVGLAVLSGWRPAAGLSVLILLLPCAIVVERLAAGALVAGDVVDGLALAFAGGALFRLAQVRSARSRLAGPAAVLAVVVFTSVVTELRALQLVTPRASILPDVWHFVTVDYWSPTSEFPAVRHGFRWLAWLATAVLAERLVLRDGRAAERLLREWFISGAIGSALVVQAMFQIVAARETPFWASMVDFWQHQRLSVLQPDLNAAGSSLLLLLVPALVVGVLQRRWWLIGGVVPLLLTAFGLARSRAAIGAAVLVLCMATVIWLWRRWRPQLLSVRGRATLAACVVLVALLGAGLLALANSATSLSNASVNDAMRVRLELAATGLEAVKRNPAFGVGLSDYIPSTRRFVRPEMTLLREFAPQGENAHNNYLQIAAELGVPACVLFLWLVVGATRAGLSPDSRPAAAGLSLGVVAFLGSAVLGHPLLVPLAGSLFFVALGLNAGFAGPLPRTSPHVDALCWLVAGVYLGSLVWRW